MTSIPTRIYRDELPMLQDVAVNIDNIDSALDAMVNRAKENRGYTLFTINLDHLVKLRVRSPFFRSLSARRLRDRRWLARCLAVASARPLR